MCWSSKEGYGGNEPFTFDGGSVHSGETRHVRFPTSETYLGDPFDRETSEVTAPFTGVLVGVLENPVVYPGNLLCHLVAVGDQVQQCVESRTTDAAGTT